jgi:uncharacterized protein
MANQPFQAWYRWPVFMSSGIVLSAMAIAHPVGASFKAEAIASPLAQVTNPSLAQNSISSPYPQRQSATINDYAGILLPADKARIQESLQQLKASTGIEVVLVTVPSIQVYETGDPTFEAFATNLFNTWGIGDGIRNDGVLVLFSEGDRAVRIELGRGYSSAYDARMQAVINQYMLPRFRAAEYSAGLYEGTQALIDQFTRPAPTDIEVIPAILDAAPWMKGFVVVVVLAAGLAGVASIMGIKLILRLLQPKCDNCHVPMKSISRAEPKAILMRDRAKKWTCLQSTTLC